MLLSNWLRQRRAGTSEVSGLCFSVRHCDVACHPAKLFHFPPAQWQALSKEVANGAQANQTLLWDRVHVWLLELVSKLWLIVHFKFTIHRAECFKESTLSGGYHPEWGNPITKEVTWYALTGKLILAQKLRISKIQFAKHKKIKKKEDQHVDTSSLE